MIYTFYIEGLNREVSVKADSERLASKAIWNSLSSDEKDAVACLDCVDEQPDEQPA